MQKKSFNTPDDTKTYPKTKVDVVTIDGKTLLRNTYEPGWRWSADVRPAASTDSCQVHHTLCIVSGRFKVTMDDGTEVEVGPGDVVDIPPGHDGQVLGDEPVISYDVAQG